VSVLMIWDRKQARCDTGVGSLRTEDTDFARASRKERQSRLTNPLLYNPKASLKDGVWQIGQIGASTYS
jgi:hypothetical protein